MGEPKPLASLSSSLLARKGQAKPAMRPQGFASFGFGSNGHHAHEDLGWNDMGHDPAPAPAPVTADIVPIVAVQPVETPSEVPVVVRQQEELQREWAPVSHQAVSHAPVAHQPSAPQPVPPEFAERAKRAAPGSKGKAAFTLRLDPDRHLRLRLACAVAHKSAQALVVAALDAFLDTQPAVSDLARAAGSDARAK